ncbi:hypothetical protein ACROYT_G026279 [Oculina patagonica]
MSTNTNVHEEDDANYDTYHYNAQESYSFTAGSEEPAPPKISSICDICMDRPKDATLVCGHSNMDMVAGSEEPVPPKISSSCDICMDRPRDATLVCGHRMVRFSGHRSQQSMSLFNLPRKSITTFVLSVQNESEGKSNPKPPRTNKLKEKYNFKERNLN